MRKARASEVTVPLKQYSVKGLSEGQKEYIQAIQTNRMVFCTGPAGTGKTFLATSLGVLAWAKGEFNKIIITRPLVTAGEDLGFLPGDTNSKSYPFLRPIYDEMENYLSLQQISLLKEANIIEICPFAYMRGRTFKKAFIIADEIQNATQEQVKMLTTRIGPGSKLIINGDESQSDLPMHKRGSLSYFGSALKDIENVAFVQLANKDIVRDPLVEAIVNAMEKYDEEEQTRTSSQKSPCTKCGL
jgi:phosphate starvation-inducible PhoH-like protein